MITRLLARLFGPPEEINGANRCPTYLYRWHVLRCRWFAVYLHRFVGDDWSLDLHDHPKRFASLMLWGGYTETTAKGDRDYAAPSLRSFPASHAHRVRLRLFPECWTLVMVFAASRPWGFWHAGTWIHWRDYVKGRFAHIADRRATCTSIGGDA